MPTQRSNKERPQKAKPLKAHLGKVRGSGVLELKGAGMLGLGQLQLPEKTPETASLWVRMFSSGQSAGNMALWTYLH